MRNDQIFVLMLVVLLPLTGCFDGGGIGDADGQDTAEQTETTVNNFYNTTTVVEPSTEYFVASGTYGSCNQWTNTTSNDSTSSVCNSWTYPTSQYTYVEISANTTIRIHGISSPRGAMNYFSLSCDSGFEITANLVFGMQYTMGMVATDGSNCSLIGNSANDPGAWSIVYEIVQLTII